MASKEIVASVCGTIKSAPFQSNLKEALPSTVSLDQFTRCALTAIQMNPSILDADRQSLFNSLTRCAQDGLRPDGKEAALVKMGESVAYMPMIGGLRKIAAKYGCIIATGVVYENDLFEYELGVDPVMRHVPPKLGTDRGEMLGAWAQAKDKDGNIYLDVMDSAAMEVVRSVSRAKSGDLWTKWKGEAYRKTVGRRLFKTLPLYDMDEVDARVLAAADEEMEFTPPQDAQAPAATPKAADGTARRPSALQAVVDAGSEAPSTEDGRQVAEEVVEQPAPAATVPPVTKTPAADDPF